MNAFTASFTNLFHPSRQPLRTTAMALFIGWAAGCSGTDVIEASDSAQPFLAENTESQGPDENGLTIFDSTGESLSGTLSQGEQLIRFDLERSAEQHVTTVHAADGEFLLRMTLTDQLEKLEIGLELSLEGPTGSIFISTEPQWERVRVSGELSRLADGSLDTDVQLVGALGPALAERSDIDPSIIPPLYRLAPSPVATADATASELGTHQQAAGTVCGACLSGCQIDFGFCLAFAGIFGGFCVQPFISCMNYCSTNHCQ